MGIERPAFSMQLRPEFRRKRAIILEKPSVTSHMSRARQQAGANPNRRVAGQPVTSICRGFSQKIICATASFACIWARMFCSQTQDLSNDGEHHVCKRKDVFRHAKDPRREGKDLVRHEQDARREGQRIFSGTPKMLSARKRSFPSRRASFPWPRAGSSDTKSIFSVVELCSPLLREIFSDDPGNLFERGKDLFHGGEQAL